MKKKFWAVCAALLLSFSFPSLSFAKGVPLFFQTGDELFEIEGSPKFEDYSVGYACKRFGIFGADVWTWDCQLMAVDMASFSAGDLPEQVKAEYASKYSLSDRKRGFWNHYGIPILLLGILAYVVFSRMRKQSAE